jgi:hypothetical protein
MTTNEVANILIKLCEEGKFIQAQEELYHNKITSIETDRSKTTGASNMLAKERRFLDNVKKINFVKCSEPLTAGNYFTIVMQMSLELKNN